MRDAERYVIPFKVTSSTSGPSWWSRCRTWLLGDKGEQPEVDQGAIERPWRYRWEHLPKRTAGFGFSHREYQDAGRRAEDVARLTLGDVLWKKLRRDGYLDLPSRLYPGLTYRLRIGRRIEVRCAPGVRSPWSFSFLCINPTYPLPEAEFFAHLYLYVRDSEEEILRVAAPQPWDQVLGRTF
ncbi:MAG: hypothetical protein ACR2OE_17020 [Thermomicrobiales bacterium]